MCQFSKVSSQNVHDAFFFQLSTSKAIKIAVTFCRGNQQEPINKRKIIQEQEKNVLPSVNVVVINSVGVFFSFYSVSYSVHVSEDYPGTVQHSCPWHMYACYCNLPYSDENIWKGVDVFQVHPSANHVPLVRLFSQSFLLFRHHLSAGSGWENLVHKFTETGALCLYRDRCFLCLQPTAIGVRKRPTPLWHGR